VARHLISINQEQFVQQADRHGIATTTNPQSATVFSGQELLKAITLAIHHEPEAVITLIPKSSVRAEQ
jgi:hypothetical protein